MAKMLPAFCPDSASQPEKVVYERLEKEAPKSWVVLHSLDIARHPKKAQSEIDFVVIVPEHGVICLEVKGFMSRRDGVWDYRYRDGSRDAEGPFVQAETSSRAIKARLREKGLGRCFVTHAVLVPENTCRIDSPEWEPWQLIDRSFLNRMSLTDALVAVLSKERTKRGLDDKRHDLSKRDVEATKRLLRPDFETLESPRERIERLESEARYWTEEQFDALDDILDNDHVVVRGPAGTGKTVLAIEMARRAVEQEDRVLLLCKRGLLGTYLRQETSPLGEAAVSGSLDQYVSLMISTAMHQGTASRTPSRPTEYTRRDMDTALSRLLAMGEEPFDRVIVDESQDFFDDADAIDLLEASLKGGFATGSWTLFGDFEMQDVSGGSLGKALAELERRSGGRPFMKSLKKNCRNTPQIAEEAHDIAGFPQKHGYRRCLRRIEGPKPDWICPNGTEQVTAAVVSALRQVRKEGYEPEDTRILLMPGYELPLLGAEPHPEDPSALAIGGQLVASAGGGPRLGMPEVLSVEDFKGLEAAACIVVGGHRTLDQCEYPDFLKRDDYLRSNLYIAFTRAKHRLFVVLEGITHKALAQKLPADYAHLASIRSEQDVGANGPYTDLHHIVAHHAKRGRRRR